MPCGAEPVVVAPKWRYHWGMPSIQVKDVPKDIHATLRRRAALAGQSLQEYLLERLRREAATPTIEELFGRIEHRSGGVVHLADAEAMVRTDRDSG